MISGKALLTLCRKEARIKQVQITLSTTYQQIFTYNPSRFAIVCCSGLTSNLFLQWPQANAGTAQDYLLPYATGGVVFTEDELGSLIHGPLWAKVDTGTPAPRFTELIYDPRRQEVLNRVWDRIVSDYGTP